MDKKIDQILDLLRNKPQSQEIEKMEQIAAKIIRDISNKTDKCECSKEITELLKNKAGINRSKSAGDYQRMTKSKKLQKNRKPKNQFKDGDTNGLTTMMGTQN
ncbi:hypothetical protein MTR67_008444 [Solanum verrucosum]|uniref:Uncharacterized protein n=1 Tax=Solanum verrucosum TaxID=315347 RepID=A0AAF0Q1G0_SOLVR|nr:hypothetical protein MTR67_008444 [Solanum verrucosum]